MRKIGFKYHIEGGQIIKTSNGVPISEDEPVILFRARDDLALPLLRHYKDLCSLTDCRTQAESMDLLIELFEKFKLDHPELMKKPGITKGK